MNYQGKRITDQQGRTYELEKELGRGGQGAVYRASGGRKAIKVLFNHSGKQRELLSRRLQSVRQMHELKNLPIASPLAMLQQPHLGYVMELITGMVPISRLIYPPRNINSLSEWFLSGGGLHRRLLLLARCGEILTELHAKGLVYGDPSPNNIFVSEVIEANEVYLIDADNLHYGEASSSMFVYTPNYGAPELVLRESGVNFSTDAHAFAVIVFQALTLIHPLMGDLVLEGEPKLEEEALKGALPWVGDLNDTSNSTCQGIPQDMVLSPRLKNLSQDCFGTGLRNPRQRPKISKWVEALYSAADFILKCQNCSSTYYACETHCPWCDHPSSGKLTIYIKQWEPKVNIQDSQTLLSEQKVLAVLALSEHREQSLVLTERIISGRVGLDYHSPVIELKLDKTDIYVRSLNGKCFWLSSFDGKEQTTEEVQERWKRFPASDNRRRWLLHFGPINSSHRLALFKFTRGGEQS